MSTNDPELPSKKLRIIEQRLSETKGHLERLWAEHLAAAVMTGDRRYRTLRSIEGKIGKAEEHRDSLDRERKRLMALPKRAKSQIFSASEDYCSIIYEGVRYMLTPNQSTIIRLLHEAYLNNTPSLSKRTLLSAIEAETSRVRDSFKNSPLWGTLIIANRTPRGTYQLQLK